MFSVDSKTRIISILHEEKTISTFNFIKEKIYKQISEDRFNLWLDGFLTINETIDSISNSNSVIIEYKIEKDPQYLLEQERLEIGL